MTPEEFVAALKEGTREGADSEADYFAAPSSPRPPKHLARFSKWFRRLSTTDQEMAREVIRYAAEGSLFGLLTYLDNLCYVTEEGGTIELWHVGKGGARVRLNDPEGDLLTDLFNNSD